MSPVESATRRDFVRTGAAAGALLVAGAPTILRGAPPAGQAIKVGVVGCGGRGTGAANQALNADDFSILTAVADVAQEPIDACLATLRKQQGAKAGIKVAVEKPMQFVGLDAFERVLGVRPALIRSGGTLPIVAAFADRGIPTIITGFSLPDANIHSPNENMPARYVPLGIETARALFEELGKLQ